MNIFQTIAKELSIKESQVENTAKLIDEGNTIPFIARYRKEVHGSLDDTVLRELNKRLEYLRNLESRKEDIKNTIEGQDKMTDKILTDLDNASTLTELEDIYRPFKQKRKTRASVARENGLLPLAESIFAQNQKNLPEQIAEKFLSEQPDIKVENVEEALKGASDIIAEMISDDADIRKRLKAHLILKSRIVSKAADEKIESVYTNYYDFSEPVTAIADHRILALNRGEKENFLKVSVSIDKESCLDIINQRILKPLSACRQFVINSAEDAYDRLIFPSVEREIRNSLTERAVEGAIKNFSTNLRQLLLQRPLKGKNVLGLDPAYRTGCKFAVVNETGSVKETGVVYPTPPHNKIEESEKVLSKVINKHEVDVIAIGNGTASRETELFAVDLIGKVNKNMSYTIVNEAGASVYSASELACEEFPNFDVSLRSAVSIARRLQDPLAELVKIDPKAVGVGQYQHDMPATMLGNALKGVVEDSVNSVGVDLNTASPSILSYISGINTSVSKEIVKYREKNGAFSNRKELLKVPKLGAKAFEQCAGFLRIPESKNILDNTQVHPESYETAKQLLSLCGYSLEDSGRLAYSDIMQRVDKFGIEKLSKIINAGVPTLNDIVTELQKPGRDPRDTLPQPILRKDVMTIEDLKPGMKLTGTVRNVIDFGAFIDIGVHQDGLVHISEICDRFIRHPSEVLKVGDIVNVYVLGVDPVKKRISLSMKNGEK